MRPRRSSHQSHTRSAVRRPAPRPARRPSRRRSRAAGCARCQANHSVERGAHARRLRVVEVDIAVEPPVGQRRRLVVADPQRRLQPADSSRERDAARDNPAAERRRERSRQHGVEHRDHGGGQGHADEVGAAEGAAPAGRAAAYCSMFCDCRCGLGPTRTIVDHRPRRRGGRAGVGAPSLRFVRQEPQLGTGHAVQQAVPRSTTRARR